MGSDEAIARAERVVPITGPATVCRFINHRGAHWIKLNNVLTCTAVNRRTSTYIIKLDPVRAAMVDEPAHCRWTSYRHNALGASDSHITPHVLYQALGQTDKARQTAYRALFRAPLDGTAIDDIRLALNQNQPLGNARFYARIEKATGVRREARPRGRPRL